MEAFTDGKSPAPVWFFFIKCVLTPFYKSQSVKSPDVDIEIFFIEILGISFRRERVASIIFLCTGQEPIKTEMF